jgi:AraC family transcriptional regulator
MVQPKLVERAAFAVLGVQAIFGVGEQDFFDKVWMQTYMSYEEQVKPLSPDKAYYGVWFSSDDKEHPHYLAGMMVEGLDQVPAGLVLREVPAARYAVFDTTVSSIGPTYDFIYQTWLPASEYEYDIMATDFEYYPPDTLNKQSAAQIYIPVKPRKR